MKQRNHSFKYLTKHAGKGSREGIWILHNKDSENIIVKTYSNRKDIEKSIIEYNMQLYQQVHETEVYRDKIYSQLQEGLIRDKILKDEL